MRYLAFASLLALQIILGSCGKPDDIKLNSGDRLTLEGTQVSGKIQSCTLKITNQTYSIFPNNDAPGSYTGTDKYCEQTIRNVDASLAGLWTMTTETDNGETQNQFKVQIRQEIDPIPSATIIAYDGEWIRFGLDLNGANVTSCTVTNKDGRTLNLMEKIEGVTMYGACGIHVRVNASVQGYWVVHALVGDYLIYDSCLIEIDHRKRIDNNVNGKQVPEVIWNIGTKGEATITEQDVVFCQWTKPDGTKMPLVNKCVLKIPSVSAYHQGTWQADYAIAGMTNIQHREILIKTNDENLIECEYHSTPKSKEINILCKTGQKSLEFCSFKKPDNSRLNLPAGAGNSNYSYYGRGYQKLDSGRNAECGVTIHMPSHEDFGLWTCEIYTNSKVRGAVINVANTRAAMSEHGHEVEYPPVFVKRGDSFKLHCKVDAKLDYCWISSPDGTAYSVLQVGNSGNNSLKYNGKGLEMGECGAEVPGNDTNNGDWLCHMGIDGGFEVERKVPVKVTESYIIAHKDTVLASEKTILTCRSIVDEESTVQYCRWVGPNGHGINRENAWRYTLSQDMHECSLIIMDVHPEDLGKWTCFALMTASNSREEWATVQVRSIEDEESKTTSVLSIVLGTGFLVITLIGACYAALFVYRRRNVEVKNNPPPYYPEDYPIPNGIQTSVDSMHSDKNYKY